ncbi:MAG TPA: DUF2309 domain-containing protein, partial [Lacipirellulaceae bacterium]|nr:DUF2309 domain-containing protein [Lacipirellulaceae bacterium]
PGFCRHRDWLLEATGEDCDELVHEILVPFSAAFLDQGVARASLPARHSFYQAFAAVYGRPSRAFRPWMSGLAAEIRRIADRRMAPLESIEESLQLLGVDASERDAFITDSLLALRGYAGLLWQTEQRGDRVAHPAPPDSLVEFLAVRLILDRLAAEHVGRESMAFFGGAAQVRQAARRQLRPTPAAHVEQRAFLIFQLSQLLGWSPEVLHRLTRSQWTTLLAEAESFSRLERRRIYHLAYERKYQVEALDAIVLHRRRSAAGGNTSIRAPSPRPSFEIICCIDDREESFRRHLEELDPGCRTYGTAGFFAVAMYYRGAADAHFTPLCPVIIKPQHYVVEQVADMMQDADQRRRRRRQALGAAAREFHLGSRTVAGGWLAGVVGSLASVPLVMRILFPRMTARLRQAFGELVSTPAATRLQLERTESTPGEQGGHVGYRPEEMAANVERLLRDIGLTENFSKLVFVCGHGSSSLNNPHGAAYDCGACAGGRGGPNARAFAQMANRPDVRALVARNGIHIPSDTVFIGAYHNTCNDSVAYYDLDALPASHHATFEASRRRIDEARRRNAQERCRRFESARLNMSGAEALRHVEGRAEDLSQVRPECGHAGNAICLVGRREWSRNLFLDRRAFLQSYDPAQDDEHASILDRILQAVIPVCAGINLEYYFSFVDSTGYGCGSKLPHNVTSLLGVMNGASSDLLPGLPWQMVEIHEPMRLLLVIEATPAALKKIIGRHEGIARLVDGQWVQLATFDADRSEMHWYRQGRFERHVVEAADLPEVMRSIDWYRGWRDHLGFAAIRPAATEPETLGDG